MNKVGAFALNSVHVFRAMLLFGSQKLIKSTNISKITSLKYAKVKLNPFCVEIPKALISP